jgi:hypothetical protein
LHQLQSSFIKLYLFGGTMWPLCNVLFQQSQLLTFLLLLLLLLTFACGQWHCRRMFGLAPATSFRNITPDAALAEKLEQLYAGNINNMDAYVGGLAEPHFGKAHVGQLFYASIFDQFRRLRDGDYYHFKNADNGLFNAQEIAEIERTGKKEADAKMHRWWHVIGTSCLLQALWKKP